MPNYEKCDSSVNDTASEILCRFETHQPLLDAKVKIDYVFAHPSKEGGVALKYGGVQALGIARKLSLKDRAMGRGDCEVSLDGNWWKDASEKERAALLDHELHHFSIALGEKGLERDDLGRPKIFIRKHDFDFGWFKIIADRHGAASIERMQARKIFSDAGQFFWPEIVGAVSRPEPALR